MTTNTDTTRPTTLVLGATGKTGRRVAAALRERGLPVRAASRSAAFRFDWDDRGTWGPALDGASAVYLVDSQRPDAADTVGDFSRLAAERGVRRLVLLSAREDGDAAATLPATESAVKESGVPWTILRPGWFSQNFTESDFLHDSIVEGEVRLPTGTGLEPFIDADDIAAVAVAALTEDGHAGQTYELSGPRLLTFEEAVGEIARATGRDIRFVPVSVEEYVRSMTARGYPAEIARFLGELFDWVGQKKHEYLSDGVRRALGREPRDFSEYVKSAAAAGAWNA
ncbi:uncharacterized protein YbjT (DUF2867 family) [Nocardiopsis mwathae]|uniref:Uncharacterized protein YbjT (DUF2867 family) n=1 Tax=Nocardiopsis mwathae TaxID=1472723 RepID=A0A7W9YG91_9ACTN|nr:NAD(P)H-binding protein [Nocardiopsis mwathae]MBB6171522.1 uncharacterized protein YbjT (DUF2867 family) [Nocardiopsis mwathae]